VSLIEALVALAVMAFGLLAVVGLQASLRANGDISRQRAEAARIAQAAVEDWRSITGVQADGAKLDYTDLITDAAAVDQVGVNATYRVTRTVTDVSGGSPPLKWLMVTVAWTDRADVAQTVQLGTSIAGVAPELAGTLAMPPSPLFAAGPPRNGNIPAGAQVLDAGHSAFVPPQGLTGTVVWVFNNFTGLLQTCTIVDLANPLAFSNITGCSTGFSQLLQGYVNFAEPSTLATATQAQSPTGTAFAVEVNVIRTAPSDLVIGAGSGCFTSTPTPGVSSVSYFCAIPTDAGSTWSGYAIVTSASLPVAPAVGGLSTCRYTSVRQDTPAPANVKHPRAYTAVGEPLSNQNFLVVRVVANDASDCPTGSPLPSGTTTFPQPQTAP
jgi:Tfp pilus assembly protein PilV